MHGATCIGLYKLATTIKKSRFARCRAIKTDRQATTHRTLVCGGMSRGTRTKLTAPLTLHSTVVPPWPAHRQGGHVPATPHAHSARTRATTHSCRWRPIALVHIAYRVPLAKDRCTTAGLASCIRTVEKIESEGAQLFISHCALAAPFKDYWHDTSYLILLT